MAKKDIAFNISGMAGGNEPSILCGKSYPGLAGSERRSYGMRRSSGKNKF